jgi:peptide-methionine (R)-S-oxide reductase
MRTSIVLGLLSLFILNSSCNAQSKKTKAMIASNYPMQFTNDQWKERLTKDQYYILRQQGTEAPGTGKYDHFYQKGTYYSAATLQPLFSSETKFDSGTGWPSFYAPISKDAVILKEVVRM